MAQKKNSKILLKQMGVAAAVEGLFNVIWEHKFEKLPDTDGKKQRFYEIRQKVIEASDGIYKVLRRESQNGGLNKEEFEITANILHELLNEKFPNSFFYENAMSFAMDLVVTQLSYITNPFKREVFEKLYNAVDMAIEAEIGEEPSDVHSAENFEIAWV